ncbi:hypothetical protein SEA_ZION_89 [Corynebacterium phage Zion]|uniref:Uncharacterized protein n=3 Tax=Corynebacterium virus Zion TaxID=2560397 RepID=A0A2H4P911_9CAUD|nr:hypothetical protein FDJ12_gp55 [Corynebacterium phage Zion]ATW58715.1 hypothetical protein SEA_POTATOCHIP_89 [Corynebacterium phage PotatoChip]ATW58868.1 hypothetical protein SEA_ZION_89 [Corynebacterium phage Zion]AYR03379.1 hypothetical protein PETEYPAB_88 [Corynebacterium phage PeteyPab]
MEKNFYNVGNIYGVYTAWDEWDSQTHWDTCVEDLKNIGAVLISNERYGGVVGADDVFKDWQDCMEDIDRLELEIEDLKCELTDTRNDQNEIGRLTDELIGRVEELENGRVNFGRFNLIEGYHYNLLVDMVHYVEFTGNHTPKDEDFKNMLKEYSAAALGEVETIQVVEIDKCPNWVEEIADLDFEDCENFGGFEMTTSDENLFESNLIQFLMDQGLPLGKRHKLTKVDK